MSQPEPLVLIPKRKDQQVTHPTLGRSELRFSLCEYDTDDDWPQAVNALVESADAEIVWLHAPDAWFDENLLGFHELAFDADVVYGRVFEYRDGEPHAHRGGELFCPYRLQVENYLPELAFFRRDKFLAVGGVTSGMWDLYAKLAKGKARFKCAPEIRVSRNSGYEDRSVPPERDRLDATFYYQATPGTAYWRCQLPARYLPGQAVFNVPNVAENNGLGNHQGAAVMQFPGDAAHHNIAKLMQGVGYRVLLETDDNYLQPHQHMRAAGWGKKIGDKEYTAEGHKRIAAITDGVIVTTDYLAKQYRKLNEHVYVCPNQIDPVDWPELAKPDDGVFRVGWFASRSHLDDARLIGPAMEWAGKQPGVEVVVIGAVGANANGTPTWPGVNYKYIPWSNDFGVYRRFIAQLNVGLGPIVGTPWANCRSDLKALEYGMVEAVPVLSDVPPYADWQHGDKCLKARDAKGFLRAVQHLVRNQDEARRMAAELRAHVLADRTVERNIDKWRQAIGAT